MLTENVYYAHKPDAIEIFPYRNGLCRVDFIVDLEETDEFEDPQYKADVYSLVTDYNDGLYDDIMDDFDAWIDKAKIADLSVEKAQKVKKVNNVRLMAASVDSVDPRTIHNAETFTSNLQQTVYGGSLDIATGELIVDKAMVTFNDVADYITIVTNSYSYISPMPNKAVGVTNLVCTCYETVNIAAADMVTGQIKGSGENKNVFFKDGRYTDKTAFLAAMGNEQIMYVLAEPRTYQLSAQEIELVTGTNTLWADNSDLEVRYAESYKRTLCLTKLPIKITVTGAGEGTTTLAIERVGSYDMDRPDESVFDGHDGETVALLEQTGEGQIEIDADSLALIGSLDDGASYKFVATVSDSLGQSATVEYPDNDSFVVQWEHQAREPLGTAEIVDGEYIARITPQKPTGWEDGDTCDIYRLSADRPELIYSGAEFGQTYIDPYPTIGDVGGHRLVYRTRNGDYITPDNTIAWLDINESTLDIDQTIIDFEGRTLLLNYGMNISHSWSKDFTETKYLGGSVQGDWNPAVSRSGTVTASMITLTDRDDIETMRRLADYSGICHIRTPEGSSYAADIQVSEENNSNKYLQIVSFSLKITRVDAERLDGVTLEQWEEIQGE